MIEIVPRRKSIISFTCHRHMKMHMKEEYVNMDDLNEGQFTAMYFQTFDLDRSGQIDGLEMLKAMLKMNSKCTCRHNLHFLYFITRPTYAVHTTKKNPPTFTQCSDYVYFEYAISGACSCDLPLWLTTT